jgi:hypothetical protein
MKYDWNVIQAFYNQGRSTRECMAQFGFTTASWTKARKRGDFVITVQKIWNFDARTATRKRRRGDFEARTAA